MHLFQSYWFLSKICIRNKVWSNNYLITIYRFGIFFFFSRIEALNHGSPVDPRLKVIELDRIGENLRELERIEALNHGYSGDACLKVIELVWVILLLIESD